MNDHIPSGLGASTTVSGQPSMEGDTREPAFPRDHRYDGHNGMTLRDYFAAKAMQAFLIANPNHLYDGPLSDYAEDAYDAADEMLKARAA